MPWKLGQSDDVKAQYDSPNKLETLTFFFWTPEMNSILSVVTTAPREPNYLGATIYSIKEAGFNDILLISEPESHCPENYPGLRHRHNPKKLGAWHSFRRAITETIWISNPDKHSYIAYFQDDIVIHPETCNLLTKILPRLGKFGYLSLYTPTHYNEKSGRVPKKPGLSIMEVPAAYGACALIFRLDVAKELVTTNTWKNWLGVPALNDPMGEFEKRKADPTLIKHVDAGITRSIQELKLPAVYFHPSLVQHIGEVSSLGHAPCPVQFTERSRRIAQHIVNFNQPLYPQVIKSDEQLCSINSLV